MIITRINCFDEFKIHLEPSYFTFFLIKSENKSTFQCAPRRLASRPRNDLGETLLVFSVPKIVYKGSLTTPLTAKVLKQINRKKTFN